MFVRHGAAAAAATVTIAVEGREVRVPAGVSVAAALLGDRLWYALVRGWRALSGW